MYDLHDYINLTVIGSYSLRSLRKTPASWIGEEYSSGGIFKKKILILGESHYCSTPGECPDCGPGSRNGCNSFTCDVISDQFKGGKKLHAIYTKLAKLLLNADSIGLKEKESFWQSVAYYNYVQTSVGDSAGIPPTDEMFNMSEPSFQEVMDKLVPDFLLVVSCRLWDNMPGQAGVDWPAGPVIEENGITERTWYYKGKLKITLSLVIYHPSSRSFSYEYIPVVKRALSMA